MKTKQDATDWPKEVERHLRRAVSVVRDDADVSWKSARMHGDAFDRLVGRGSARRRLEEQP